MRPAESQATTATQLTRIAWLSARDPQKTFQSLMHHFNETSLKECFHQLDGRKPWEQMGSVRQHMRCTWMTT